MLSIRYSDIVFNYFPILPQMQVLNPGFQILKIFYLKQHFLIYGDLRLREI